MSNPSQRHRHLRCRRRRAVSSSMMATTNADSSVMDRRYYRLPFGILSLSAFILHHFTLSPLEPSQLIVANAFSISGCSNKNYRQVRPTSRCVRQSLFNNYHNKQRHNNPHQLKVVSPPTEQSQQFLSSHTFSSTTRLSLFAPPGSGYAQPEDYPKSELPDTYEPMMAYPGTMRPGKTPENMPFQDLPIGDNDPDPVPWPHFQQIEWHHRWSEPPHPHPGTMEDFIESIGRWATPEQEAAMRVGARREVRERQEQAESEKRETIITDDDDDEDFVDDDDDDDDFIGRDEPVALGDGIFGKLGSDADRASTVAAVTPGASKPALDPSGTADAVDDLFADSDDLDDFLLDLGLGSDLEEEDGVIVSDVAGGSIPEDEEDPTIEALQASSTATFTVDDNDEVLPLGLDGDDDDDLEGDTVNTVPLDDFGDSDSLDVEDIFDEGGFDYDDGDFGGGDDVW